ncbi:MAG: hypothetical protein WC819_01375 [Parcubacteria group bacterium]|jgi:hypothetical protein
MLKDGTDMIVLPGSPFWDVFKRFGSDEVLALVVNTGATFWLGLYFTNTAGTDVVARFAGVYVTLNFLLSLIGPVVEKVGFFPLHFWEAFKIYRSTIQENRRSLCCYFGKALRKGSKSLMQDVLIHDPVYFAIMYVGLLCLPETPAWLLSFFSFVVAVFIVAGGEVSFVELLYLRLKRGLKRLGFSQISYLESRFYYDSHETARMIFDMLVARYDLATMGIDGSVFSQDPSVSQYYDRYIGNKLPVYNARRPRVRFRQRESRKDKKSLMSIQIVFTLTKEMDRREVAQYRYFPIRKDKFYCRFSGNMCENIVDILDPSIRRFLKRFFLPKDVTNVQFVRMVANNPQTLLVSLDQVGEVSIVELKTYLGQKTILKEAMRLAMHHGGQQTTHDKHVITHISQMQTSS